MKQKREKGYCIKIHSERIGIEERSDSNNEIHRTRNFTDSIINNRVSEQTKHFTMESLILAQDER
jgi:hypothetical protein